MILGDWEDGFLKQKQTWWRASFVHLSCLASTRGSGHMVGSVFFLGGRKSSTWLERPFGCVSFSGERRLCDRPQSPVRYYSNNAGLIKFKRPVSWQKEDVAPLHGWFEAKMGPVAKFLKFYCLAEAYGKRPVLHEGLAQAGGLFWLMFGCAATVCHFFDSWAQMYDLKHWHKVEASDKEAFCLNVWSLSMVLTLAFSQ